MTFGIGFAILPVASASAMSVPFLSQAPFGILVRGGKNGAGVWYVVHEDTCEEASAIMAVAWARGQTTISKSAGRKAIIAMSDWEKKTYGSFVDTSVEDTADRLVRRYLGYQKIGVRNIVSTYNIQDALRFGTIVIAGVNAQVLRPVAHPTVSGNHHMILITGYDPTADIFIANDPGSSRGAGIRITREHLQNALQDYPSGDGTAKTVLPPAMIVIGK